MHVSQQKWCHYQRDQWSRPSLSHQYDYPLLRCMSLYILVLKVRYVKIMLCERTDAISYLPRYLFFNKCVVNFEWRSDYSQENEFTGDCLLKGSVGIKGIWSRHERQQDNWKYVIAGVFSIMHAYPEKQIPQSNISIPFIMTPTTALSILKAQWIRHWHVNAIVIRL